MNEPTEYRSLRGQLCEIQERLRDMEFHIVDPDTGLLRPADRKTNEILKTDFLILVRNIATLAEYIQTLENLYS